MPFKDIKKILLIQLGDIGDVVWVTPTIWAVRAAYPATELSLLVREGSGSLLAADPAVDKIFEVKSYQGRLYDRWKDQLLFLRRFRSQRFDLVIDLRADERGAFMARLSGAPLRVAEHYNGLSFLRNRSFNYLVHPTYRKSSPSPGAAEQSLRIVRELGVEATTTIPRLWLHPEVKKRVQALLQEEGIDALTSWCTLNPFARWSYKELAYGKWAGIMDWLGKECGLAVVLVGAASERKKAAALAATCTGRVFNLAGKTSLAELAGVLSLSSLHMGVDSAAPHIAAAMETRTVTVYGPSDWRDWAPPGEQHRVVVAQRDCVPCRRKGCDDSGLSRCLEELSPEKIKAALQDVLT